MEPGNLEQLTRVYSPRTWAVYEDLEKSLQPRSPQWLIELAIGLICPGDRILDAGCRDAAHLVELLRATSGTSGVGVEPVIAHVEQAQRVLEGAALGDRARVLEGSLHALPIPDGQVDVVWCRDVLEQVDPLEPALAEMARVLRPGGCAVVFTTVVSDLLDDRDEKLLRQHQGNVYENLDRSRLEAAFASAGLLVERCEPIGTEWREYAEERTQPVSRKLLQLARLRRRRDELVSARGLTTFEHVEANLHWEVFQFLGKLLPVVYTLRKEGIAES